MTILSESPLLINVCQSIFSYLGILNPITNNINYLIWELKMLLQFNI